MTNQVKTDSFTVAVYAQVDEQDLHLPHLSEAVIAWESSILDPEEQFFDEPADEDSEFPPAMDEADDLDDAPEEEEVENERGDLRLTVRLTTEAFREYMDYAGAGMRIVITYYAGTPLYSHKWRVDCGDFFQDSGDRNTPGTPLDVELFMTYFETLQFCTPEPTPSNLH